MAKIQIVISANSKDLGDANYERLSDISSNGIELYPKQDDFPMPWDAYCLIEGGMFIIEGDLGQQGFHGGYAKVGIPLNKVMNYIGLSIYTENDSEVREILQEYGWL